MSRLYHILLGIYRRACAYFIIDDAAAGWQWAGASSSSRERDTREGKGASRSAIVKYRVTMGRGNASRVWSAHKRDRTGGLSTLTISNARCMQLWHKFIRTSRIYDIKRYIRSKTCIIPFCTAAAVQNCAWQFHACFAVFSYIHQIPRNLWYKRKVMILCEK